MTREQLRGAAARDEDLAAGAAEGVDAAADADDTDEIRAGIKQTRSEMSETIDAIQERLSPQHLGEQVKEQVREQISEVTTTVRDATIGRAEEMVRNAGESFNEARYGLMETIRHNPIPTAMVGLGLGWLMMNRRSAPPRRYSERQFARGERSYTGEPAYPYRPDAGYPSSYYEYEGAQGRGMPAPGERRQEGPGNMMGKAKETVGGVAEQARDTAGHLAEQARDTAGSLAEQARDTAGSLAEQARDTAGSLAGQAQHQARRVEDSFQQAIFENPLGVAAAALAIGAAVGMALPRTERENQLMGEARESFVEKAQEVAQETMDKAQRVAGEAIQSAEQTARERSKEVGLTGERR